MNHNEITTADDIDFNRADLRSMTMFAKLKTGSADNEDGSFQYARERTLSEGEGFVYPTASKLPTVSTITSADHEKLSGAATSGDLDLLQKLFLSQSDSNGRQIDAFLISNTPHPRTGSTLLQTAASKGRTEVVKWLIGSAGAMVDFEDSSGETALHKASINGHLEVVKFLVECNGVGEGSTSADVAAQDADGWTALHNACSKGYLDIVKYICDRLNTLERDSQPSSMERGVDRRSKAGWTPLMNAASQGHLPIVLFLLHKQSANPLKRNNWGETASCVSAGVFEIWISEILAKFEKASFQSALLNAPSSSSMAVSTNPITATTYNNLSIHTTVPLVLFENQRLDLRLKTRTLNGGMGMWTASGLKMNAKPSNARNDRSTSQPKSRAAAFTLRLPEGTYLDEKREIPCWKSDVELPTRSAPFTLPLSNMQQLQSIPRTSQFSSASSTTVSSQLGKSNSKRSNDRFLVPNHKDVVSKFSPGKSQTERSHFWLSDWTLDLSPPSVGAVTGWQYAPRFDSPDEIWVADPPLPLQKLLDKKNSVGDSESDHLKDLGWVRRRRWVRVMKRRLDIPPLPFLEPDGKFYSLTDSGDLTPYQMSQTPRDDDLEQGQNEMDLVDDDNGQELSYVPLRQRIDDNHTKDYVSRAQFIAGRPPHDSELWNSDTVPAAKELRKAIPKLERAVSELRTGVLNDNAGDRRTRAEVLLNVYSRELEKQRLQAGAMGLYSTSMSDDVSDTQSSSGEEDFQYPTTPTSAHRRSTSPFSHRDTSSDYFSRSIVDRGPSLVDLTPHLSQAPEFRVPTHEATTPRWNIEEEVHGSNHGGTITSTPSSHWEKDEEVIDCGGCHKRFSFLFRKHCRKCGRIFCDKCTSYRCVLEPQEIVLPLQIQAHPELLNSTTPLRVCEACYNRGGVREADSQRSQSEAFLDPLLLAHDQLSVSDNNRRARSSNDNVSQISDLADCPVCSQPLGELGTASQQEAHLKACLDGGRNSSQMGRYLVYKLPAGSTLIGTECVICLEEFCVDAMVARLSCLCGFHKGCLQAWLTRGRSCPVHAR